MGEIVPTKLDCRSGVASLLDPAYIYRMAKQKPSITIDT